VQAGFCKNELEQAAALKDIDQFGTKKVGTISFKELHVLVQRIVEQHLALETARMEKLLATKGYEAGRIIDLQSMFDDADVQDVQSLTFPQTLEAFETHMISPFSVEQLEMEFKSAADGCERIDLLCFAKLVTEFGEGKSWQPREPPFTLQCVSEERLREVLRCFPIAESYIENLERGALIDSVSNYTGIPAGQNLREMHRPIRNAPQLVARTREGERGRRP